MLMLTSLCTSSAFLLEEEAEDAFFSSEDASFSQMSSCLFFFITIIIIIITILIWLSCVHSKQGLDPHTSHTLNQQSPMAEVHLGHLYNWYPDRASS